MTVSMRIWISALGFWIAVYLPQATIGVQAKELENLSPMLIGLMWAMFGIALVIARIPIGIASVIFKEKSLLMVGLILIGLGLVIVPIISNPASLLVSRFLLGLGTGFWVIYTVLYVGLSQKSIPAAMSEITLAYGLGITIASLIGGILVEWKGWFAPFWIGLVIVTGAIFILAFTRIKDVVYADFKIDRLILLFRNAKLIFVSFLAMIFFLVFFATVLGFNQNYVYEHFEIAPFWLGILMFSALLPYSLCIAVSHIIRNKLGLYQTIALGFTLAGFGIIGIPFAPNIGLILFLHIIIGFGLGMIYPTLMAESIKDVPDAMLGEAMGIFQSVYAIGIFL
ncbi:MAG: MFS transporter, partial [Elusimicrobiota bacterium]|nr:MFS transporter [Elusimicrobiota bacterium]